MGLFKIREDFILLVGVFHVLTANGEHARVQLRMHL